MKKCPSCNREFPDERKFCPYDGTPLPATIAVQPVAPETSVKKCPSCGREFPAERKFCPYDGTRLGEVTASQKAVQKDRPAENRPKIIIRSPEGDVREVTLDAYPQRIGSGPENPIQLTDAYASRRHATLLYKDGRYLIIDAGSANGVFVNGERIGAEGHELRPGDQIVIGKTRITFSAPAITQAAETFAEEKKEEKPQRPVVIEEKLSRPAPAPIPQPVQVVPAVRPQSILDGRYEI
ncbi:MAG TPA: FHA domain-containing protein, partial [Blastocatellia bacterium]|nr:FHA domain-containing protein [Blastocatellia bacterium]